MREIHTSEITDRVAQLCQEANFDLGEDVLKALDEALQNTHEIVDNLVTASAG